MRGLAVGVPSFWRVCDGVRGGFAARRRREYRRHRDRIIQPVRYYVRRVGTCPRLENVSSSRALYPRATMFLFLAHAAAFPFYVIRLSSTKQLLHGAFLRCSAPQRESNENVPKETLLNDGCMKRAAFLNARTRTSARLHRPPCRRRLISLRGKYLDRLCTDYRVRFLFPATPRLTAAILPSRGAQNAAPEIDIPRSPPRKSKECEMNRGFRLSLK